MISIIQWCILVLESVDVMGWCRWKSEGGAWVRPPIKRIWFIYGSKSVTSGASSGVNLKLDVGTGFLHCKTA